MLKTNIEFSRGILFIRLKGDLNKNTLKDINKKKKEKDGKMIICDKYNISRKLLKDIPKIEKEYDAYKLFERMI